MTIDGSAVQPLTPNRFDDLVHVLRASGIGGCWCMCWTCPSSAVWGEGASGGSEGSNKASSVYLGLASTFERLGFEVVQRRAPHKPMMRLRV